MEENIWNVWSLVVGLSGAFGLGMCFASLGSISVKLMPRMDMNQSQFGSLVSTFMFSCLIFSLVVGASMDAIGYKWIAVIGFLAVGISFLMLANAKTMSAAIVAGILLGVGAMACNTTGNVLGTSVIIEKWGWGPAAANNLVNVFFGLGLFLMPFIVSFLFQKMSYEKAISTLGILLFIPIIFGFLGNYKQASGFSLAEAFGFLTEPVTIIAGLVLFCYMSLETSFTNWLAPFGKEVVSQEKPDMEEDKVDASAARLLSAFAIMMMAGRLFASFSHITVWGSWLLVLCAIISTVIIFSMMGVSKGSVAFVLAGLAGFIFGPLFPTTVGITFGKFGGPSGSLFGIIFAIGLIGAITLPKAIGNAATGSSVQKSLKLLVPIAIALAILALILNFLSGPADEEETASKKNRSLKKLRCASLRVNCSFQDNPG